MIFARIVSIYLISIHLISDFLTCLYELDMKIIIKVLILQSEKIETQIVFHLKVSKIYQIESN